MASRRRLLSVESSRGRVHARLGARLGPKGITVNVVQPGPIDTELNPSDGIC